MDPILLIGFSPVQASLYIEDNYRGAMQTGYNTWTQVSSAGTIVISLHTGAVADDPVLVNKQFNAVVVGVKAVNPTSLVTATTTSLAPGGTVTNVKPPHQK